MSSQPGVADWKREVYSFIEWFLDPSGEELVQLTSGTTGDPKKVVLSREAVWLSARRTLDWLGLRQGDSSLLCLPVRYIAGKMMVARALAGGLSLRLTEPSGRPLKDLSEPVDFAAMVPLQVHETLEHGDPLSHVARLIIGGGQLHASLREKMGRLSRPQAFETFGMTETCTHFAMKRINGPAPDSMFRFLDGVRAGVDRRGCLEVEIPGITRSTITTNDLVELREGGFIWLGRQDHVINSGGIKIIPELVEEQVRRCTGMDCLVLPEADEKLGQQLVLAVEYPGGDPPLERWLECLRLSLSGYEIPRRVILVDALPRNASMKPDRTRAIASLL